MKVDAASENTTVSGGLFLATVVDGPPAGPSGTKKKELFATVLQKNEKYQSTSRPKQNCFLFLTFFFLKIIFEGRAANTKIRAASRANSGPVSFPPLAFKGREQIL